MIKSILKNKISVLIIAALISGGGFFGCGSDSPITTSTGNPSDLSRTGKFISFTSNLDGDYDIFIIQVDANGNIATTGLVYGTNPYNLTNTYNANTDKQSNWSPNGRVLVYSATQGNDEEVYAFFFKVDGGIDSSITPNPKMLFTSNGNWDNNPSYSPDGNYLIWDRRYDSDNNAQVDSADARDLYIGDIVGSGSSLQVQDIHAIVTTSGGDEYNPKWSPRISTRKIAYEYQPSSTATDHDVYIIDPFDTTNNVNFYNPNNSGYPAWAPECNRIIFESDKTSGNYWKIVFLPYPASGNPADLVDASGFNSRYPTRLPNGNLLAYIRITLSTGTGNIYVTTTSAGGVGNKLLPANFDNFNNLWPAW
ncbi:hypothetical protein ACFLSV_01340 [Bacteroidota bacterium]